MQESPPLLRTKLHIPPVRPELVPRPRLIERLSSGLLRQSGGFARKLTLISAPAGFGKTTLVFVLEVVAIRHRAFWVSEASLGTAPFGEKRRRVATRTDELS